MKKILILAVLIASFGILIPSAVLAETSTVDDSAIEKSLREQGLDKAPKPVEIKPAELYGLEPSSGFVDENGKALSDEEYAAYRKEQEKGIFEKYPFVSAGLGIVIIGLVAYKIKKRR